MIGLWSIGMMASGAGGRYRQIRRCIFQELTEKINEASFNYWDNWTGWLLSSRVFAVKRLWSTWNKAPFVAF